MKGVAEMRRRQISLGICAGLSTRQIAAILGIGERTIGSASTRIIERAGMADRHEFALWQNAAVRELMFPEAASQELVNTATCAPSVRGLTD